MFLLLFVVVLLLSHILEEKEYIDVDLKKEKKRLDKDIK